jgi:oligopeptide transport system substrate-binding protein
MKFLSRLIFITLLGAGIGMFHQARQKRMPRVQVADEKQILLIGNGTEIESLDPHMVTGQPEHRIISAVFEGLVAPGAEDPDADAPGVAESWESADMQHWTFHLRKDEVWSDGTPLTAKDFLYAWQRILSPELGSQYAEMLYLLKGAASFNKGETKDFSSVGVIAPDEHTLQLTLEGPAPYFPGMLKHYTWFPVPQHTIEKFGTMTQRDTPWARPGSLVSNGAFTLKDWRIHHFITVMKNPRYWDAAQVGLNEIQFFPIDNGEAEERVFLDGQLHVTDTVPLAKIPLYRKTRPAFFEQSPELSVEFYRCNVTRPPLDQAKVRQALSLSLDRVALVDQVIRAGHLAATGYTPPGSHPQYPPLKKLGFDPDKARQLLAEAGFPNGKGFRKIEILTNSSDSARTIAEFFQESWKKQLGIEVTILQQDWQVYLTSQHTLKYDIARAGWVGDYTDPFTFLGIMGTGDGNNDTGWGNPKYDELLAESKLQVDVARRMELLREAETLLLDELPIMPIYWKMDALLIRPEVQNWRSSVLGHRCYKAIRLGPYQPLSSTP